MKRNNLRKVYMAYCIVIGELIAAAFLLCSPHITPQTLQTFIRVVGMIAAVMVPVVSYVFYRWLKKDNAAASDELEQMLLLKAFALTGLVAVTLTPFLFTLCCIFPEAVLYTVFGFTVVLGATFKLTTIYLYKKY